jgi:hypothetical protein
MFWCDSTRRAPHAPRARKPLAPQALVFLGERNTLDVSVGAIVAVDGLPVSVSDNLTYSFCMSRPSMCAGAEYGAAAANRLSQLSHHK